MLEKERSKGFHPIFQSSALDLSSKGHFSIQSSRQKASKSPWAHSHPPGTSDCSDGRWGDRVKTTKNASLNLMMTNLNWNYLRCRFVENNKLAI